MPNHLGKPVQAGFSLVELMVAMTIGLALVAGVATLSLNSSQTYRAMGEASQQLENGRYGMEVLKEDLHHAGFFGEFVPCLANACRWQQSNTPTAYLPANLPDPCADINSGAGIFLTGLANSLLLPLTGYNNPTSPPVTCISSGNLVSGTDVFVIRRADTNALTVGHGLTSVSPLTFDPATYGNTYIQTTDSQYIIGFCSSSTSCYGVTGSLGQCSAATGCPAPASVTPSPGTAAQVFSLRNRQNTAPAAIRRFHVHIYFIRPWSSTTGDGIPTLVRLKLTNSGNNPSMNPQVATEALIEGIENMQVRYGLDDGRDASGASYGTALVLPA